MAIAFVQRKEAGGGSGTTIVIPSGTYATGSALAVWVIWEDVNTSISSVAQSSGSNTWSFAPPAATTANGVQGQWCYALNITGFTGTITVTIGASSGFNRGVSLEYTGIATASALDGSNSTTGNTTSFGTGSITTTNADDLLLAGLGLFGSKTCTFGANWTNRDTDTSETIKYCERIVSATGTYSVNGTGADGVTFTGTESWVGSIMALKAASGGGGGTPTYSGCDGTGCFHHDPKLFAAREFERKREAYLRRAVNDTLRRAA